MVSKRGSLLGSGASHGNNSTLSCCLRRWLFKLPPRFMWRNQIAPGAALAKDKKKIFLGFSRIGLKPIGIIFLSLAKAALERIT